MGLVVSSAIAAGPGVLGMYSDAYALPKSLSLSSGRQRIGGDVRQKGPVVRPRLEHDALPSPALSRDGGARRRLP